MGKRLDLQKLGSEAVRHLKPAGELAAKRGQRIFIVGGMVRDLLLGRPSLDIDIVVEGDGIAFARSWADTNQAEVLSHPRFGTAVLTMPDGRKFDVVTARKESYRHPGALPDVCPGTLSEDLRRRDFTINALAVSILPSDWGILYDELGGLADLQKGVVRTLHERSFIDDPTRILRAVRYEKRFRFRMSRETLSALKAAVEAGRFATIAPVRYWNEFRRILEEDDPVPAVERLSRLGAMQVAGCTPETIRLLKRLVKMVDQSREMFALTPWHIYCAALLLEAGGSGEAGKVLTRFGVGRQDKQKIADILQFGRLPVMLDPIPTIQVGKSYPIDAFVLAAALSQERDL